MLYICTHARLLNDRDLRARAEFHYTPLTSHVQGAEAPGTGLTRDMMDLSTAQNRHSESVLTKKNSQKGQQLNAHLQYEPAYKCETTPAAVAKQVLH